MIRTLIKRYRKEAPAQTTVVERFAGDEPDFDVLREEGRSWAASVAAVRAADRAWEHQDLKTYTRLLKEVQSV